MDAQVKAIEEAEAVVKGRGLELAKAKEALAHEERSLQQAEAEASAAKASAAAADPDDSKGYLRRRDDAAVAAARVEKRKAQVAAAQEGVAEAERAAQLARCALGRLKLDGVQRKIFADLEGVEPVARQRVGEIAEVLRKVGELMDEAEDLRLSIQDGEPVAELPSTPWGQAILVAKRLGQKDGYTSVAELLGAVGRALCPRTVELTEGQKKHIAMVSAAEDRTVLRMANEAASRRAEEAEAAERRRAGGTRDRGLSLQKLAELNREAERRTQGTHDGDYTPTVG